MTALEICAITIIGVGLILVLVGTGLVVSEERHKAKDKGLSKTIESLAKFADALSKHPVGIRLVFLGIVLIVIGGSMSGVATLTAG